MGSARRPWRSTQCPQSLRTAFEEPAPRSWLNSTDGCSHSAGCAQRGGRAGSGVLDALSPVPSRCREPIGIGECAPSRRPLTASIGGRAIRAPRTPAGTTVKRRPDLERRYLPGARVQAPARRTPRTQRNSTERGRPSVEPCRHGARRNTTQRGGRCTCVAAVPPQPRDERRVTARNRAPYRR